jgi:hypothetical protein
MHMLNRRLQVLVDDERFERLARESERTSAPVGELVRRAIDREFPGKGRNAERERAGRELLAMPPPPEMGSSRTGRIRSGNCEMLGRAGGRRLRRFLYDTSIVIYALGREHPYREPCRDIARLATGG